MAVPTSPRPAFLLTFSLAGEHLKPHSGWCRSPPPLTQSPAITSTWLMGRDLSLDFLAGAFSVSDVYLWRGNS